MKAREILEDVLRKDRGLSEELPMDDVEEFIIRHALASLSALVEGLTKHADSYVKDGRERLLAVGYNQALSDVQALFKGTQ